ncbi:hypothetical protein HL667_06270 [Bradyrhizobium sp. 83012]|uniref:Bacteriophage tail tape measure N-terminal domain-containing protein n=1 Tax=Bradyrhizobium aeschynomenes TaxID=2734909 RepID=A0ABX2CB56_9BRAD|nr:hypothetical protein [Bradyrhizobium aeschynomenes]NPU64597.1 hypothetical protein [Bradyrhizobium aeschynomenes]
MCIMALGAIAPIIGILSSVGSAIVGYAAQKQAADEQNAYYARNARAAQIAAVNQYANEQNQIIQKRNAASQQVDETHRAALQARSTARVAAGEAGVTGLSVDALINDYYGREGRRVDSIDQNYEMDRDYMRANMESTRAQAEQRINSVKQAAEPSFADAAIRIVTGITSGAVNMAKGGATMAMAF